MADSQSSYRTNFSHRICSFQRNNTTHNKSYINDDGLPISLAPLSHPCCQRYNSHQYRYEVTLFLWFFISLSLLEFPMSLFLLHWSLSDICQCWPDNSFFFWGEGIGVKSFVNGETWGLKIVKWKGNKKKKEFVWIFLIFDFCYSPTKIKREGVYICV